MAAMKRNNPNDPVACILEDIMLMMRFPKCEDFEVGVTFSQPYVRIKGPASSVYEGLTLGGEIHFPDDYPRSPPWIVFDHDMCHPNVHPYTRSTYAHRKMRWNVENNALEYIRMIINALRWPNLEVPVNHRAHHYYKLHKKDYKMIVRDHLMGSIKNVILCRKCPGEPVAQAYRNIDK